MHHNMEQTTLLPHDLKKHITLSHSFTRQKKRDISHALVEEKNVFYYQTFKKVNGDERRKWGCVLPDFFNP